MMKFALIAMPCVALFIVMTARSQPNIPCVLLGVSQIALLAALVAGWRRMKNGRRRQVRIAACCVVLTVLVLAPFSSQQTVLDLMVPGKPLLSQPAISPRGADPVGRWHPGLDSYNAAPFVIEGDDDEAFFTVTASLALPR